MTIEDMLRASLAERLDSLEAPPGDLGAALRDGSQARRRRPLVVGVAAACLAVVVATGVVLAQRDGSERLDPTPAPSSGDWTRLPAAPLSPRANALTVWTGDEVLVLGGEVADLCPPNADCVSPAKVARDGAAYDPDAQTWRTIAAPPLDVLSASEHLLIGDVLVIAQVLGAQTESEKTLYGYDVSDDAWRRLPATLLSGRQPIGPGLWQGRIPTALGAGRVDLVDALTGQRSSLPRSSHVPAIQVDRVVATPEFLVVLGLDSTKPNDGIEPSLLLAEVWNGSSWRRLGPSEILGSWGAWHWTGERLVAPYGECLDGGETNNYGRCIPTGGAMDPATGVWQPLQQAPPSQGGWTLAAAEGPLVATWGQLYDDREASWTPIERAEGAPPDGTGAVFGDGTLFAYGGVTWRDLKAELSGDAWAWTP